MIEKIYLAALFVFGCIIVFDTLEHIFKDDDGSK